MDNHNFDLPELEKQRLHLEKENELYKHALESQLSLFASKAKKTGAVSLAVGGALFVGYFIFKKYLKSNKKKLAKPPVGVAPTQIVLKHPKQESAIAKMIKEQIAIFIMAVLKKKVDSYIKAAESKK
ncbi:MAG TPA: hypothetical protein VF691_18740 [Cytophagaceae bacterium]|jgi:hypothetical protein